MLACAALLPGLVTAAAVLASPAPYGAEGLDWFAGLGQSNADDIRLPLSDPGAARARWEKDRLDMLATGPAALARSLASLLPPADAAALSTGLAEYLARSVQEGLRPGSQGWWDDSRSRISPWRFGLDTISVPVLLLHGRQDNFVPFSHGQWLAAHIPGVQARLPDGDGHLTLAEHHVGQVHAWLSQHL